MAPFVKRFDDNGHLLAIYAVGTDAAPTALKTDRKMQAAHIGGLHFFNNYETACGFISGLFSSPAC
jgi:hypothetical protein